MLEGPYSSTYQALSHLLKSLPSHLKVELILFGDSKFSAIHNNLTVEAFIKYIKTTNKFSVPLFRCCFLSLALNIYIFIFFPPAPTSSRLFPLFYLTAVTYLTLWCIFLPLFWLSICKTFFIYFLYCLIVFN